MANTPKRMETLVGFFLFVGLGLLGLLILQYGRFAERFQGFYTVTVSFTDASGVIKGSAVRLSGAKVGQVAKDPKLINAAVRERLIKEGVPQELIKEGNVLVELYIRDDAPKLDKNSIIQIDSLSILGDKVIKITPPRPPEQKLAGVHLEDGDFVEGGGPSGLEALQGDAADIAVGAKDLMTRGGETLTNIDTALAKLSGATDKLAVSIDRVNAGLLSEENMENLSGALADLKGATGNIEEASLEIKPLIADATKAVKSFDQAAEQAEGTFAQASSEISKLGPALKKVPQAVDSISGVADDARETLQSVKNSEGLLGTLAYDREVKQDAKTFLRNLRHYGILRYRDAATFDERDPRNRFRGRRR